MVDHADYSLQETSLEPGDLLFAYSDALSESLDDDGRQLGSSGLLRVIQTIDVDEPMDAIPTMLDQLRARQSGNLQEDDVTAVLLQATQTRTLLKDNLLSPVVELFV